MSYTESETEATGTEGRALRGVSLPTFLLIVVLSGIAGAVIESTLFGLMTSPPKVESKAKGN